MSTPVLWPIARLRQFGGGAWIIAAGLIVGGTFAPLSEERSRSVSVAFTAWGVTSDQPTTSDYFPDFGIPLVIGAVIMVAAALLAVTSTRLHPASGAVLAARLLGTGAAGVTIGCTVTLYLLTTLIDQANKGLSSTTVETGLGTWLLIAASVVGVVGSILMLVPKMEQRLEPETPPMGIPVVRVLEPEYDEPAPEPEQRG
ncbi:hypothetical protein [Actinocrispum wychmicini]|uniref:Uncharacterized protein n=1 Tax=Actinocrispum wychmicini TaxID=1213861 RepID=A0A4R2JEE5_9PSEU|nr:hypothetical protein [Actinocrispum wychmicini]TCO56552.1 hypothetical protein EV192_10625 [Actinocrispum wychmicini]